jgi:hypothetical protein
MVIMAPIKELNMSTLALSADVTCSTNVSTELMSPVIGFQELMIVQPSHTKRPSER